MFRSELVPLHGGFAGLIAMQAVYWTVTHQPAEWTDLRVRRTNDVARSPCRAQNLTGRRDHRFALTLIGTLLGEMFGLGYLLKTAIGLHNVDQIMGVTFLQVVFAAIVSAILIAIDRRLHVRSAT
jgi:hypothetical protein